MFVSSYVFVIREVVTIMLVVATIMQVAITVLGIVILGQMYGIVGIAISYVLASLGNFTYLFFANRLLEKPPR